MRRIIISFTIALMLTVSLSSCYDAVEIDDRIYVLSIGIDRGVSNTWRVTFQIPLMESAGSSAEGGGMKTPGYTTITVDAPAFFTAVELVNISSPRKVNFTHAKYLVFSEDLAKSGLLGTIIAPMVRCREIRRTMDVIVSKGAAYEFLKENKPFIGINLSKSQEGLISQSDDTGFFPAVTLNDLYNGMKSTYRQPIVALGSINNYKNFEEEGKKWDKTPRPADYFAGEVPREGGGKIELMGCMIGDGDKIITELNGYEARILMMANGDFKRGIFTLKDPEKPDLVVMLSTRQKKAPEIKVDILDDKPVIHEKISLEGEIIAIQSRINYESPELVGVVEREVEKIVKEELDILIKRCKALKCDVFNFGYVGVRHFMTIQEWEAYNWNKHFEDAEVTTEVKFSVVRTGTMLKSSPIISSEGSE